MLGSLPPPPPRLPRRQACARRGRREWCVLVSELRVQFRRRVLEQEEKRGVELIVYTESSHVCKCSEKRRMKYKKKRAIDREMGMKFLLLFVYNFCCASNNL